MGWHPLLQMTLGFFVFALLLPAALSPTAGGAPGALSPAAGGANLAAPVPSPGNSAPAGCSLSVGYSVSAVAVGLFLTLKSMRV